MTLIDFFIYLTGGFIPLIVRVIYYRKEKAKWLKSYQEKLEELILNPTEFQAGFLTNSRRLGMMSEEQSIHFLAGNHSEKPRPISNEELFIMFAFWPILIVVGCIVGFLYTIAMIGERIQDNLESLFSLDKDIEKVTNEIKSKHLPLILTHPNEIIRKFGEDEHSPK